MTPRASLADEARIRENGYRVDRFGRGWVLVWAEDGATLQVGEHGGVSPTRWEAVAEALSRIEQDERLAGAMG